MDLFKRVSLSLVEGRIFKVALPTRHKSATGKGGTLSLFLHPLLQQLGPFDHVEWKLLDAF
ncbi:MAG: hypothetical protein ABJN42_02980, partial [Roseibium sp.]|uniref:hypothetical protein n=1 Tax=Roseibium sp. TaxID=1936156 RepID=UPI003299E1FA